MSALGEGAGFSSLPPTICDLQQLFYKGNERDLVMEIHAADAETGTYSKQIVLTFNRNTGRAKLSLQDLPATFTQIGGAARRAAAPQYKNGYLRPCLGCFVN